MLVILLSEKYVPYNRIIFLGFGDPQTNVYLLDYFRNRLVLLWKFDKTAWLSKVVIGLY